MGDHYPFFLQCPCHAPQIIGITPATTEKAEEDVQRP